MILRSLVKEFQMTIAKSICGVIAAILFFFEGIGFKLGTINNIAWGLFFLTLAIAPIPGG